MFKLSNTYIYNKGMYLSRFGDNGAVKTAGALGEKKKKGGCPLKFQTDGPGFLGRAIARDGRSRARSG